MNGSHSQHRDEPQEENLGLDLVSEVSTTSRVSRESKPKRWILVAVGLAIIVVLAIVTVSLLNGGTKASKASSASDAVIQTVKLNGGGEARLSSSKANDAIGVELSGLPPVSDSEQYVAWAVHEAGSVSVVVATPGEDASAGLTPAEDVIAIHITVEGSKIPSAPSDIAEASIDLPLTQDTEEQEED